VLACYQRFLDRFSTAYDLAAAELNHVLKAWEGLGYYYARARNLHAGARLVVVRFGVNGLPIPFLVAEQKVMAGLQSADQRETESR